MDSKIGSSFKIQNSKIGRRELQKVIRGCSPISSIRIQSQASQASGESFKSFRRRPDHGSSAIRVFSDHQAVGSNPPTNFHPPLPPFPYLPPSVLASRPPRNHLEEESRSRGEEEARDAAASSSSSDFGSKRDSSEVGKPCRIQLPFCILNPAGS